MATTSSTESAPDYVHHAGGEHSHKHQHDGRDWHLHRHQHAGGDTQHAHGVEDSINQSNAGHQEHHTSVQVLTGTAPAVEPGVAPAVGPVETQSDPAHTSSK